MSRSDHSPSARSSAGAPARAQERRLLILGSTGSIGTQALETVAHLNAQADAGRSPVRYRVAGLAAGRNAGLLAEQARRTGAGAVAIADAALADGLSLPAGARVLAGAGAAEELVRSVEADVVLAAMVGSAGLPATLAAVELGRDVALANKETLVAAGGLIIPSALASSARLLPVDSEHSALWQALQGLAGAPHLCPPLRSPPPGVSRLVLTASGGALRSLAPDEVYHATPAMALRHPTWTMGAKVTIDSASLTNKAFEVIEAHWLFAMPGDRIDVLVHPQSIVHSLVAYGDGNILAQLGSPDMRLPIQYALTYPTRVEGGAAALDAMTLSGLTFSRPDLSRFPALKLAYTVIERGGTSGAIFNAASEAAVEAFLASGESGRVPFGRMGELVAGAMSEVPSGPARTLADVLEADARARAHVREALARAVPVARVVAGGHAPAAGANPAKGRRSP